MKAIIAAIVTCLALFAISFGASNFLLEKEPDDVEVAEDTESTQEPVEEDDKKEFTGESRKEIVAMPVALRPENAVSVEAIIQMSDSIKKMEQQLIEREKRVAQKEQRVNLLFEDLLTEQDELRAFSDGIDAKVASLNLSTENLKSMLDQLDTKKLELEKLEKAAGEDEQSQLQKFDNKVNDVKGWFAGLQPDQAATYLKEFANNGKLDFAASLLQKMPDRQKSKILGSMNDPILVDQLIDALKVPPKKP